MKLRDFLDYLFMTTLNNLSIADTEVDKISETNLKKVTAITNNALVDLYTRFPLKLSTVIIQSIDWKSNYLLDSRHSLLNGSDPIKYIVDTPMYPFKDDIIRILGVTNEVGQELPLNDAEQWASVFTPSFNTIQLTHVGYEQVFEISYQASHPRLEVMKELEDTLNQEVSIPFQLKEALSIKVAIDFFSAMAGQEESNKTQVLISKFENICAQMANENFLSTSDVSTNVKLLRRGFP